MSSKTVRKRPPSLIESLAPVLFLIALLSVSVYFFGEDASYGPNQIALILSAGVAALFAMRLGFKWKEIEKGIVDGIALATGALLILLVVGSLIGTWILSGIVPGMIYWGLQILHPSIFFVAACAISGLVSFATGSSWTTVSTIGIALIGIAGALDLSVAVAAGAIISGAYFGDKLSPLSDTTNLAPAMAGTDLFTHIRHMLWTTVPSMSLALLLFLVIGFFGTGKEGTSELEPILDALSNSFEIRWYLADSTRNCAFHGDSEDTCFPGTPGWLLGGRFIRLFVPTGGCSQVCRGHRPSEGPGFSKGLLDGVVHRVHC